MCGLRRDAAPMSALPVSEEEKEVERGIRDLVDWVVAVKLQDIPAPVLRKAVVVIADNVAAMIAARAEPEVAAVHQQLLNGRGRAEATIFREGSPRTDRISAALANGIAGSWCE